MLGIKIETFAFPWNSYDYVGLNALRELGFKTVLGGGRHEHHVSKMRLICNAWEHQRHLSPLLTTAKDELRVPGLAQIAYHSWMWDDAEIATVEKMLSDPFWKTGIHFLTAQRARGTVWKRHGYILYLNYLGVRWAKSANRALAHTIKFSHYYMFSPLAYVKKMAKAAMAFFVFEKIGIHKIAYGALGIFLSIFLADVLAGSHRMAFFHWLVLICGVFAIATWVLFLKITRRKVI